MFTDSLFTPRRMTSCRPQYNGLLMMRRALKQITLLLGVVVVLFSLTGHATHAQDQSCETCKTAVKIDMQGSVCAAEDVPISLAGTTATAAGVCSLDQWMTSNTVSPELKPDESYVLTVGPSSGMCSVHINFSNIPEKYKLEINGKETTTIDK